MGRLWGETGREEKSFGGVGHKIKIESTPETERKTEKISSDLVLEYISRQGEKVEIGRPA